MLCHQRILNPHRSLVLLASWVFIGFWVLIGSWFWYVIWFGNSQSNLHFLTPARIQKCLCYITSKYFSFFNNKPPVSWAAHTTRDFLTCYSCSYYSSMYLAFIFSKFSVYLCRVVWYASVSVQCFWLKDKIMGYELHVLRS